MREAFCFALLLAVSPFAGTAASAASVEIVLRDRAGSPLGGEWVDLRAAVDTPQGRFGHERLSGITDADGVARLADLLPGHYAIEIYRLRDRTLVPPHQNPFLPAPVFEIETLGEHRRVEVEVWRGYRVRATVALAGPVPEGFQVRFLHRETGAASVRELRRGASFVERALVPGVWQISVDPRPGYLLVDVDHDRVPVAGSVVTVDLTSLARDTDLTWTYAAPASIAGWVTVAGGGYPAVDIEAELVRAGSWRVEAERRGGSRVARVTAEVDRNTGRYEMVVPDGVWSVRPAGPRLRGSEPEAVELTLARGETGRADFEVTLRGWKGGSWLGVGVEDARRRRVAEALVEAYPLDGDGPDGPVAAASTDRFGRAMLDDVPPGDYLLVANHPDHLEGSIELRGFRTSDTAARRRPIVVGEGATIAVAASGQEGEALPGVRVVVERLGEPPETRSSDAELAAARANRTEPTDLSGRAVLRGFYPGLYRVRAELSSTHAAASTVRLRRAGERELSPEVTAELGPDERLELEARLVAAARLRLALHCADGWPTPEAASLRVVDVGVVAPADPTGRRLPGDAVLAIDDILLSGEHRDTLLAGPLETGVYRLAVRPTGFDRWTWAIETYDIRESVSIPVDADGGEEASEVNLGPFPIECGPAVDAVPTIATGAPFPPLHEVAATARILDPREEREIARPPAIERAAGRLELRDLPTGELRLALRLAHPHLLPEPTLEWQQAFELERGRFHELTVEVEALGGAIELRAAADRAVLWDEDGEAVAEVELENGRALFPSLVPGTFRVEAFLGGVTRPVAAWSELPVVSGETLQLREQPVPPSVE